MKNFTKIVNHMVVWATVILLCQGVMQHTSEIVWYSLGCGLLAGICCVLRLKTKHAAVFIVSHLLLLAGSIYLVGSWGGNGAYAFLFALTILWSFVLRLASSAAWLDAPSKIYVGAMVVIYVIHLIYRAPQFIKTWTIVATVILFLLNQLYENLEAVDRFVDLRTMSTQINTTNVKNLSKQISLLYVGALGLMLGLCGLISMDGVWNFVKKTGDKIMRFIVSLIPEGQPAIEKTYNTVNNNSSGDMLGELAKENPIMQKIGEILVFLGGIVIAIAFAVLFVRGAISIYRYFRNRKAEAEEQIVIEKLYVGKEKSQFRRGRLFQWFEQTPSKRVRKIYKRNMKKLDDSDVRDFPYLNPNEQVERLAAYQVDKPTREEIKHIYEKARYSKEKVTDHDAKRINAIM